MRKLYFLYLVFGIFSISISNCQVPGSQLFDNAKIHEIKIVPFYENLRDTLEANYMQSFGMNQFQIRDIPYSHVKLIIDGTVLDTLAIRYKGFNSWWHSVKKPIKIDINKYKSGQKYDGLNKFNLHNGSGDPSFIRENISYKILRSLGIKAPRTSFAKVFIDTAYIGLYRIVEQIDNTFLDVNFGNHDGNLYKQQALGTAGFSMGWEGVVQDIYYKSISLDNHQKENDWSGFIHFLDVLNNTPEKNFRDAILGVFNVDEFLQILAFDIAVNNLDFYGNSGRNFYLYDHNGIFHWIPWDLNLSWREGVPPINIDPNDYLVLIKRILQVPEFHETLLRKYCQLKPYFSDGYVDDFITGEVSAINEYMKDDPYQDYPFEAFKGNRDSSWNRIPGLKPFAAQRTDEISKVLETFKIDCNVTGTIPVMDQNIFQLFPIPANDWVNIGCFPNKKVNVSVFNSYGQLVLSKILFEKGKFDLSSFSSGCYVVKAVTEGKTYSKLLIVNH